MQDSAEIAKVWRAATMPKEQPLLRVALLQRVREAELVVFIEVVHEVRQLRRGLEHGEGCVEPRVVHEDGYVRVRVEPDESLLLLAGADIDDRGGERRAVRGGELLEHDLVAWPLGVFCVMRRSPAADETSAGVDAMYRWDAM